MQRAWVKTNDSNVKDFATKERPTIYSGTQISQKPEKNPEEEIETGDMHITASMSSILGGSGSWNYLKLRVETIF